MSDKLSILVQLITECIYLGFFSRCHARAWHPCPSLPSPCSRACSPQSSTQTTTSPHLSVCWCAVKAVPGVEGVASNPRAVQVAVLATKHTCVRACSSMFTTSLSPLLMPMGPPALWASYQGLTHCEPCYIYMPALSYLSQQRGN